MFNYISEEQKIVVEYRIKSGYNAEQLSNGFIHLWKGKHQLIINGLGYDTYVAKWQIF